MTVPRTIRLTVSTTQASRPPPHALPHTHRLTQPAHCGQLQHTCRSQFDNGKLTTGIKPFNVFARVGSGMMQQKPQCVGGEGQEWKGTEVETNKSEPVPCQRAANTARKKSLAWVRPTLAPRP